MSEQDRIELRVSDKDPEMLAIKALAHVLAPLDRETAARVLGWAEARYGVEAQKQAWDRMNASLLVSLEKTAQTLGVVAEGARDLHMEPSYLRVALNRLYEEAVLEAETATAEAAR